MVLQGRLLGVVVEVWWQLSAKLGVKRSGAWAPCGEVGVEHGRWMPGGVFLAQEVRGSELEQGRSPHIASGC